MAYQLFEIPSVDGKDADLVIADPENPDAPAYTHYSYTIGTTANKNELTQRRGIPFGSFRDWDNLFSRFKDVEKRIAQSEEYYPGESVIGSKTLNPNFRVNTIMRLGALELLANIFSGRITASDKDPFPHQLALQQYMKINEDRVKRLLIADEVGLGKTIEIGLVLRDLLIARGSVDQFRCLYLTKGGLLDDVRLKLQSVIQGAIGEQNIVQVDSSFIEYGKNNISGIHIASMDAARRYVKKAHKKKLPTERVNPEILIIDECHHCASDGDLINLKRIETNTTRTYEAAYQMITGNFWTNSEPPSLVVFMSATPFRSKPQFVNLLRLLTHQTSVVTNAYSPELNEAQLIGNLQSEESPAAVIWRHQDNVFNWSDDRLFPNLKIERPDLDTSPEYLEVIEQIRETVKRIYTDHGENFGGFAISQLEKRLTSSSLAGACWIFRWCVRHLKWETQDVYRKDISPGTENLRRLIKEISQKLAAYDPTEKSGHLTVEFPSDNFKFSNKILSQRGQIKEIQEFSKKLRNSDSDDNTFIAEPEEVFELTELGLKLLNLADASDGSGVENRKLNWLKDMLEQYPSSRFLVFTESLQTCEIITKALPRESEKLTGNLDLSARDKAVSRFRDLKSPVRVLVATSAADEGFDFQVANKVVHWDLSPSPAVLMQRNGRVARLGQISDVTAYYLIIAGTHEERRDKALRERFKALGIKDERLRLKILGSLSSEEEDEIFNAVEADRVQLIDEILRKAKTENEEMEQQLGEIQKHIQGQSVIDRKMLVERLERWTQLGLPLSETKRFNLKFDTLLWDRPVFGEVATIEKAEAKIATIQSKKVTFDPEFKLFGSDGKTYLLAGLRPWTKKEKGNVLKHRPIEGVDPIGELACSLARQREADFTTISAIRLYDLFPNLEGTRYLLFATHPMREAEINLSPNTLSYLTFYAFDNNVQDPLQPQGACADDVYKLISLLEKEALKSDSVTIESHLLEQTRLAAGKISNWLQTERKLPRLGRQTYFLPIPVALVAVLP
ncbi:MAG: DEAD/DEAH box helicase [Nostoc sp. DedQUE04]|uniref:DEAD/DEAH box helicase n=1 Tax=Nostoc sp. DedQUE04 TaxID=3075390 RepID=UPI002AD1E5D0|nr:DEAD/DEAH box helicase [Nostoc sp. DedQUE04]MDZ8140477.1 DEAD/DEAH box helicase [Nostoc sp. DedQUE04]